MFGNATSPLVLCMYKFVLNLFSLLLYFFLADTSIKRKCASGWLIRRMENNNCTPNTNKYVEEHFENTELRLKSLNNLRTFSLSQIIRRSYRKRECSWLVGISANSAKTSARELIIFSYKQFSCLNGMKHL